jgi:hypothetical protein
MDPKVLEEIEDTNQRLDQMISEKGGKAYEGTPMVPKKSSKPKIIGGNEKTEDPFNDFGFGIVAYFKLLYSLLGVFFIISLLMLVNISIFRSSGLQSGSKGSWAQQYTMGNLGFSRSICVIQYLGLPNKQELGCARGTMETMTYHGIVPEKKDIVFTDGSKAEPDFCGDENLLKPEDQCHGVFYEGSLTS